MGEGVRGVAIHEAADGDQVGSVAGGGKDDGLQFRVGAREVGDFFLCIGAAVVGEGDDAPVGSYVDGGGGVGRERGRCGGGWLRRCRGWTGCGWWRGLVVRVPCVGQCPGEEEQDEGGDAGADPAGAKREGLIGEGWVGGPIFLAGSVRFVGRGAGELLGAIRIAEGERELRFRLRRGVAGSGRGGGVWSFLLGRGCCWRSCGHGWRLVGPELAAEGGADVVEFPGAVDSVADDLGVGRGEGGIGNTVEGFALGEALEEDGGEIADVALLGGAAFVALGGFADAVAAELDVVVDGEDIAGLDVLVNEAVGVEDFEGGDEAGGELGDVGDGEDTLVEDFGEVAVDFLEDGIDDGAAIEFSLAEALELEEVWMVERVDATPAGEDFFLVEVALNEANDGGLAVGAGGGEEGAAAFGHEEFFQGEGAVDGEAFVVGP